MVFGGKKINPYLKNIFNCKIHSLNKGKKNSKSFKFQSNPFKNKR